MSKIFGSHKKFQQHFSYLLVHDNYKEKYEWLFSGCQLTWYEGAWGNWLSCICSTAFPDLRVHTGIVAFCALQFKVEPLQINISGWVRVGHVHSIFCSATDSCLVLNTLCRARQPVQTQTLLTLFCCRIDHQLPAWVVELLPFNPFALAGASRISHLLHFPTRNL